jgi:2-polyprenyl-3-methyl-5-hydroxy-6-metoxy-1,4-benzoquinol methylase
MEKMSDTLGSDQLGMAAALTAALRTGVLPQLAEGPSTLSELTERLGVDRRALDLVLDILQTAEWVNKEGERVEAGRLLVEIGNLPGGYPLSLGLWGHAERFLRTGEPLTSMDRRAVEREAFYRNVVSDLATRWEGFARGLAARLPLHPKNILDVGCGSGVWSLAIAERDAEAQITGLDLPAVLDHFKARATALGLADRAHPLPGDMHEVEIPRGAFDLVVIANVLRLETPEKAEHVTRRAADGVAQNGSILIVDQIAEGTLAHERGRAVYALHLGLRTQNGQVHRANTISGWLTKAGFSRVAPIDVPGEANGMSGLLATRNW